MVPGRIRLSFVVIETGRKLRWLLQSPQENGSDLAINADRLASDRKVFEQRKEKISLPVEKPRSCSAALLTILSRRLYEPRRGRI